MIPYFIFHDHVNKALFVSIGITACVLLIFGFVKSKLSGTSLKDCFFSAVQTLVLGAAAAGAAYGIVLGVNSSSTL